MKLYITRHAEASHNIGDMAHDITSGEVYLTEKGKTQALALAEKLKPIPFDIIIVSELARTAETAEIVNTYHGVAIQKDARINDIITGMNGQPFENYRKALNASPDKWNVRFADGESFEDEKKRIQEFMKYIAQTDYKNVLIVTHGGVANMIYGLQHNLTNEQIFNRPFDNTEIFDIEL